MIVEMAKVHVLGPRPLLHEVLAFLQARRVLEVREGPPHGPRPMPLGTAEREEERRLDEVCARVRDLLALLAAPAADSPGTLPDASPELDRMLGSLERDRADLAARRASIQEELELATRYGGVLTAFVSLRPSMEALPEAETFGLLLRRDRPDASRLLEGEVRRLTGGRYRMARREVDRERLGVVLAVPRVHAAAVSRLLFEEGVAEIRLPARYAGQPLAHALRTLLQRTRVLPGELRAVDTQLSAFDARWRGPLSRLRDEILERRARLLASYRCGETRHAFVLFGWIPAADVAALEGDLDARFEGKVTLARVPFDDSEAGHIPVLLDNPPGIRPFELLLGLVSLPRYGSIDPTPWMAFFYPLFFGAILGDVGYGAIAAALALVARLRGWGGATGKALSTIALACAGSSVGFGLVYGELFGELGSRYIGMQPAFVRREQPLLALGLAVALGAVHITVGLALAVGAALRRQRIREAASKLVAALVLGSGAVAVASAFDLFPATAGALFRVSLLPLVALSVALEGPQAPLELLRMMGNVLSYSRLMALGLAGVLLVDTANTLPDLLPAPAGLAAALSLHVLAFALGLFSPAIQALRLQYVEFLDKFFEGGGRPWRPLAGVP